MLNNSDNCIKQLPSSSELCVYDATHIVNRKTSATPCLVVCDEGQLQYIKSACELDAACQTQHNEERRRRNERYNIRARFPRASGETIELLRMTSPQLVFDSITAVPLNLLSMAELQELGLRRCQSSDRLLIQDDGATVIPLYWGIVGPTESIAKAINLAPRSIAKLTKQVLGMRERQELQRLGKIWSDAGLPPLRKTVKLQDIRQALSSLGRITQPKRAGI